MILVGIKKLYILVTPGVFGTSTLFEVSLEEIQIDTSQNTYAFLRIKIEMKFCNF